MVFALIVVSVSTAREETVFFFASYHLVVYCIQWVSFRKALHWLYTDSSCTVYTRKIAGYHTDSCVAS